MTTPNRIVTDPRDRAPPPAPKKARTQMEISPSEMRVPQFSLGLAPGAPQADRTKRVSLCDQHPVIRELASKYMARVYMPAFIKAQRDDPEWAPYEALDAAVEITPLALPEGPLKDLIIEHIGTMTFLWDTDELWVEREFSQGTYSSIKVCMQKTGRNHPSSKISYSIPVSELDATVEGKDHGHWEWMATGKGGRARFWVDAKALN